MQMFSSRLLSWQAFYSVAAKGLKVFLFYLAVLSFCRAFFIFWMHDYMAATTGGADIALALWRGARLSCQTAGGLALFSLVSAALLRFFHAPLENLAWRVTSALSLTMLSILYVASFPYYHQYHTGFHQIIFNTVNEDAFALFVSLVQEFYLPLRLAGAFLLAFLLYRALRFLLAHRILPALPELAFPWQLLARFAFLAVFLCVVLLSAFGGSLRWQDAVDWENAGVTNDAFLNEAILDDFQAHYRAYTLNRRFLACNGLNFTVEEIEARLSYVAEEMKIPCEREALRLLAQQADGGMRDALSLLDQCASFDGGTLTAERVEESLGLIGREPIYRLTKAIGGRRKGEVLETVADLLAGGKDPMQLLAELSLHLRSLMLYEAAGALEVLDLSDDAKAALEEQKALFGQEKLMAMIARLHEAMAELRWTPQPRITLEVALLSLCSAGAATQAAGASLAAAAAPAETARIARLEAELAALKAAVAAQETKAVPASSAASSASARAASGPAKATPSSMAALSAAPPPASAAPDPAGEKVYAELLRLLQEQRRISVLACLKDAFFAGSGAGIFRLGFLSPLLARRTARDDYRKIIEALLLEIAGEPLALSCEAKEMPPPAPPPAPKKKPPLAAVEALKPKEPKLKPMEIDESELSPEEQSRLQSAVAFLGAKPVDLPEEQRIAALAAKGKAIKATVGEPLSSGTAEGREEKSETAEQAGRSATPEDDPAPFADIPPPDDMDAPPPGENS